MSDKNKYFFILWYGSKCNNIGYAQIIVVLDSNSSSSKLTWVWCTTLNKYQERIFKHAWSLSLTFILDEDESITEVMSILSSSNLLLCCKLLNAIFKYMYYLCLWLCVCFFHHVTGIVDTVQRDEIQPLHVKSQLCLHWVVKAILDRDGCTTYSPPYIDWYFLNYTCIEHIHLLIPLLQKI